MCTWEGGREGGGEGGRGGGKEGGGEGGRGGGREYIHIHVHVNVYGFTILTQDLMSLRRGSYTTSVRVVCHTYEQRSTSLTLPIRFGEFHESVCYIAGLRKVGLTQKCKFLIVPLYSLEGLLILV